MLHRNWLGLIALLLAFSGCRHDGTFLRPTWFHPGDIRTQRVRATVHDPYPDQDKGPAWEDARPRDYRNALPEPVRDRIYADSAWGQR